MNAIDFSIQVAAAGVVIGLAARIFTLIVADIWRALMKAVIRELDRRRPKQPAVYINGEPTDFDHALILRSDND